MTPIGGPRAGIVGSGSAIPDSVVSRPNDDESAVADRALGVRIESSVEWPEIGATISALASGLTRAYLYRVSDSSLLGDADISTLSAGDSFTIDLSDNIVSGETYNFVADAEGASYTAGRFSSPSYPYQSSDGDLEIINGADGPSSTTTNPHNFVAVGSVGFS